MSLSEIAEHNKQIAKLAAMTVRNAMENFHSQHLTDEQMMELNPLIRNAIATALHAMDNRDDPTVSAYIGWTLMLIPDYWEEPELTEEFLEFLATRKSGEVWSPN